MGGKIVICETAKLKTTGELDAFAAIQQIEILRIDGKNGIGPLLTFLAAGDPEAQLVLIPSEFRGTEELLASLAKSTLSQQCAWVEMGDSFVEKCVFSSIAPQDLAQPAILTLLNRAFDPSRPTGVKSLLREGSVIYTHSLISAAGIGVALDPCIALAKEQLPLAKALGFWGAFNALVAEALVMLPEKVAEGARVEIQLGADDDNLCASVRFPYPRTELRQIRARLAYQPNTAASPWLISRETATFTELRVFTENNSVEFTIVFTRKEFPQASVRPIIVRQIAQIPLENPEKVGRYRFQAFANMKGKKTRTAFKKSFSERITETKIAADAPTPEQITRVSAGPVAEEATTKLTGDAATKETSTIVSGEAANTGDATLVKGAPTKEAALYESKIASLQATVALRDELIAKLNKEIAEINDPMKRGVVSAVVDKQKEGLMQNLKRLEGDAKAGAAREKELMGMVDKAIQQKDKLAKENKALELKLTQASSGNNSLVVKLERQLEESNRRNAALSKKITEMGIGKKAA